MIRRHPLTRFGAVGAVAACALLGSAGLAHAAPNCSNLGDSSPVFSALGDPALYSGVPGGTFENGQTSKWTLSKDTIVNDNESFYVDGAGDSHALQLVSGGSAVSPAMCVSALTPTWRFFAQAGNSSASSTLSMWATWTASDASTGTTPVVTISAAGYAGWSPTPVLALGSLLPAGLTGTANLHVATTGKWQVDDVYVDPYARAG